MAEDLREVVRECIELQKAIRRKVFLAFLLGGLFFVVAMVALVMVILGHG